MEFDDNLNPVTPEPPKQPIPPMPQAVEPRWTPTPPVPPSPSMSPAPSGRGTLGFILPLIILLVLLGAAAVYFLTQYTPTSPDGSISGQSEGLNVSAEGLVYATPDIAKLSAGVSEIGRDTATVQASLSTKIDAIKARLKELGIEDKDIKTLEFGIYPDYGIYPPSPTVKPRSYTGRHMLEITIRDLKKADSVAAGVVAGGANEVQNVYFTIENEEDWYQQARSQAIKKAKAKATQLAEDAEIKLGRLLSISENNYGGPISYGRDMVAPGYGGTGGAEIKTGLEPGNLEIRAYVTLVYQIR